jgi:RNAse (barnase) inhibitor barstar
MDPERTAPVVAISTRRIVDWESFHAVFGEALGFPDFYGGNLDAWIDCMTYLDDADAGMSTITCSPGSVVTLHLDDATDFAMRCAEQYAALVECTAFVNWRRIEKGSGAVLALAYSKQP